MVRHIIMLAICIMFYIIGNAMALTPAERKAQFQCVLRCYRQFYNYGLLMRNTGELGLSIGRRESFDALLERFYRVLTEEFDVNMETVMNEINEAYASDEDYRIFKSKFCKYTLLMIHRFLFKVYVMNTLLFMTKYITLENTNIDMHYLYRQICIDDNRPSQSKFIIEILYYFIQHFEDNFIQCI
ncbi:uncharacterized protein LOC111029516 isoform X1 [Myzus persicae]|uniref:uncharacterized protein LOC111029516 isoform X1 n=1 Tax=Myzus persicae TaxID=13164 RepID=UPI000B932495|nr:uncharacterized protein LOC111029516 isoform X1 [Myzus persicae]